MEHYDALAEYLSDYGQLDETTVNHIMAVMGILDSRHSKDVLEWFKENPEEVQYMFIF